MSPEIQSRCVIVSPRMDSDKYRDAVAHRAAAGPASFALKLQFPRGLEIAAREEVRKTRATSWTCSASSEGRKAVAPDETTSS